MNATAIKLVIKLWHDDITMENPCEYDGWKVYSFSDRHTNHKSPEKIGFDYDDDDNFGPDEDLKAKLDTGLAFTLDYFEHGQCKWSLAGEGPQCRFDTARFAGIIIWEGDEGDIGPVSVEGRRKDAKAFIARYTLWCNGEIYGYTVEAFRKCVACGQDEELTDEEAGFYLPSCGGYYSDDFDHMVESIKQDIGDNWADYEVDFKARGCSWLADEVKQRWKGE